MGTTESQANIEHSQTSPLAIAIIGCGAVAQQFYVPALKEMERLNAGKVQTLFDTNDQSTSILKASFPDAKRIQHFSQLQESGIHLAIIASPPAMHCSQSVECLRAGISVLCEKPMSSTLHEAQVMTQEAQIASKTSGAILAVGHYRRFLPAAKLIREIIVGGTAGKLHQFEILEGGQFNWPVKSAALFKKDQTAGGVLIDAGIHVIDLVNWWLGPANSIAYEDDALGGIEANCHLRLEYDQGFAGDIKLSRDFAAENFYRLTFDKAILTWNPLKASEIEMRWIGMQHTVSVQPEICLTMEQAFSTQLFNTINAVKARRLKLHGNVTVPLPEPFIVDANDALQNMELIDTCYKNRTPMVIPWFSHVEQTQVQKLADSINEKTNIAPHQDIIKDTKPPIKIAVLGASGFIGSRIVEMLTLGCSFEPKSPTLRTASYTVIPVVRSFASLARLSRFELDCRVVHDFNEEALVSAFTGCDYVIDAIGGDANVLLGSIEPIYKAAQNARVKRLIYISSASVHGQAPAAGTDESSPLSTNQVQPYNNLRVVAEEKLQQLRKGGTTELVILRPGIVYGPRSKRWTANIADDLLSGNALLLNEGRGICNSVYIDNLVQAAILSMVAPTKSCDSKAYIISDKEEVSWRNMYMSIAKALGPNAKPIKNLNFEEKSLASLVDDELDPISTVRANPLSKFILPVLPGKLKQVVKAVIYTLKDNGAPSRWQLPKKQLSANGEYSTQKPSYEMASLMLCQYKLPITKAQQDLGYEPHISYKLAQERSCEWLGFAGYPITNSDQNFDFSVHVI